MEVILLIGGVVCLCACQYAFRYNRSYGDDVTEDVMPLQADALVVPAESTPLVVASILESDVRATGDQIDYV
jgi:hypothetical protein